ncbi:VP2 [Dromedary camel bocaparvovirus 1]|nr:VP2 [Dromedary camel bocaparvovirus 1]ASC49301.1 VP2 [Dromedary camel bocaparvovirus 1]
MEAEQPVEEETAPQEAAAGSRAGAGGGPANAGTGGVGMSTGQWIGGGIITPTRFVTRNTRQWWCEIKNEHKYKRYDAGTGARFYGFSTPWSYFNFNQYNGHFSPKEWQTLLNIAKRFRPVRMHVKVYNIQIKQIVDNSGSGGNTLFQNDLTAGLHIFCDGEHAFPYTQNPWDRGTMPELPTEPWELQQYAYVTCPYEAIDDTQTNNYERDFLAQEPFYMLENADHMIVRTGEAVEFHHEFSCGWVDNTRSAQTPASMSMNPIILSKEVFRATYNHDTHNVLAKENQKSGYWKGGPGRNSNQTAVPNNDPKYAISSEYSYYKTQHMHESGTTTLLESGIGVGPPTGALPAENEKDKVWFCPYDHPTTAHAMPIEPSTTGTRNNMTYYVDSSGQPQKYEPVWMAPNQAWDSVNITRYNPIWVKTPRVDRMTMVDTRDGTIPMAHPPGTIYMKLAYIPVPGTSHPEDYLNVYATGNVSVEIEWEYETHFNKNWRPEYRITAENVMGNAVYKVDNQGGYIWPTQQPELMSTRRGMEKVL